MLDGPARRLRLGGKSTVSSTSKVENKDRKKPDRPHARAKHNASERIQKFLKDRRKAKQLREQRRASWDRGYKEFLPPDFIKRKSVDEWIFSPIEPRCEYNPDARDLYKMVRDFLAFYRHSDDEDDGDAKRFYVLCRALLRSMTDSSPQYNFSTLALDVDKAPVWMFYMRSFLKICLGRLCVPSAKLRRDSSRGSETDDDLEKWSNHPVLVPLRALVTFCDASNWRLCNQVVFTDTGRRLGEQDRLAKVSLQLMSFLTRKEQGLYSFMHEHLWRYTSEPDPGKISDRVMKIYALNIITLSVRPLVFEKTFPISSRVHDVFFMFTMAVLCCPFVLSSLPPNCVNRLAKKEIFYGSVLSLDQVLSAIPPGPCDFMLGAEDKLRYLLGNLVGMSVVFIKDLLAIMVPFVKLMGLLLAMYRSVNNHVFDDSDPDIIHQVEHLWEAGMIEVLFHRLLRKMSKERRKEEVSGLASPWLNYDPSLDTTSPTATSKRSSISRPRLRVGPRPKADVALNKMNGAAVTAGWAGAQDDSSDVKVAESSTTLSGSSDEDGVDVRSASSSNTNTVTGSSSNLQRSPAASPKMAAMSAMSSTSSMQPPRVTRSRVKRELRLTESLLGCHMYNIALDRFTSQRVNILNNLTFSSNLIPAIWRLLRDNNILAIADLPTVEHRLIPMLQFFCDAYTHLLLVISDDEFHDEQKPLPLHEHVVLSRFMNRLVHRLHSKPESNPHLRACVTRLRTTLYDRDCRRTFCPPDVWELSEAEVAVFSASPQVMGASRAALSLLTAMPNILPFMTRLEIFRVLVAHSKAVAAASDAPEVVVTINRSALVEDAVEQVMKLDAAQLRRGIQVKFANERLTPDDEGVDEQGMFKELVEEVAKAAFDVRFGLFVPNNHHHLYPNANSERSHGEAHLTLFRFLGRILGMALHDGMVLELQFADFFLNKMLGKSSLLDDLYSLDPELYENLFAVKTFDGRFDDLELNFSTTTEVNGRPVLTELIAEGSNVAVTYENRLQYVLLMADLRLNRSMTAQSNAFIAGLQEVVPQDWLRLFGDTNELQRVISGADEEIDVEDMKRNTKYLGGYNDAHRVIKWFWEVVEEFNPEDRRQLLKFITGCSKTPVLGLSFLQPPLSVQQVSPTVGTNKLLSFAADTERMPTACISFNILRLPPYKKRKTLRDKLYAAIYSSIGYEINT